MTNTFWIKLNIILIIIISITTIFFSLWNTIWSNGDELHYLLATQSITNDQDIDLKNNYENQDYFEHHAKVEGTHTIKSEDKTKLYPFHGILTSVVVIPGYLARGLIGARLNITILHLIGAAIVFYFLRLLDFDNLTSLVTINSYLLLMPIIYHSNSIFPDLITGYTIVGSLIFFLLFQKYRTNYYLTLAGLFAGLSIFFHFKLVYFTAILIASMIYLLSNIDFSDLKLSDQKIITKFKTILNKVLKAKTQILWLIIPWIMMIILKSALSWYLFGTFRPEAEGYFGSLERDFSTFNLNIEGFLGILFDSKFGLLYYSPILILLFVGLFIWFKEKINSLILVFPFILSTFLLHIFYYEWHAGFSPSPRYLITILPIILPALAFVFTKLKTNLIVLATIIFGNLYSIVFLITSWKIKFTGFNTFDLSPNPVISKWLTTLKLENYQNFFYIDFVIDTTINDYLKSIFLLILITIFTTYLINVYLKNHPIQKATN
jgi:hypothetical protein